MCNNRVRTLLSVATRDLRHQASAVVTHEVAAIPQWLDRTVDQLEVAVGGLEFGDVCAQAGAIDAWHHAQQALVLLHDGQDGGPLSTRLLVQAYLRIASHRAREALLALDRSGWTADERPSRAKVATPGRPGA